MQRARSWLASGFALWVLVLWLLSPLIEVGLEWVLRGVLGMDARGAGFAGVAAWSVIALVLVVHLARHRGSARDDDPASACECGYPREGLRERVCPECGAKH